VEIKYTMGCHLGEPVLMDSSGGGRREVLLYIIKDKDYDV